MHKIIKPYLWILPFFCFFIGYFGISFLCRNDEINAPNIIGKHIHKAASILASSNLSIRIIKDKEDPSLDQGTILNQEPKPGRKIRPNQTVFVIVSKTPDPIQAPNLIGKSKDDTDKKLKKDNIRSKTYWVESEQENGKCITQIPAPTEPLPDRKIILYRSSGNNKHIIFPDLRGKLAKDVLEFLHDNNIETKIVHSEHVDDDHTCTDCIVEHQKPLPGSLIKTKNGIIVQIQVD